MDIPLRTTIERLLPDIEGQMYRGHVRLFGAYHHVLLLRVKEGDYVEPLDDAPAEVKDRFEEMQSQWEGAYHRVFVLGLPGQYVLSIFPFAD